MRLSRLVAQAEAPKEEVVAPSAVHEQFVVLIEGLASLVGGEAHPAARLLKRLLPSLLKDLAELPAHTLARACHDLAIGLQAVADARAIEVEGYPTTVEADEPDEELDARPAVASLPPG